MSDASSPEGTLADPEEQAQEATQPQAGTPDTQAEPGTGDTLSPDEARKLRSEAKSLRDRLKDAEAKLKASDDEKLSEAERLRKQVAEMQALLEKTQSEASERSLKASVLVCAQRAGMIDPDLAYPLLDASQVERDSDGEPANVEELVSSLVSARPYLVRQPQAGGGSPSNPNASRSQISREQLRAMSPEQIAALPQEQVEAALRGG